MSPFRHALAVVVAGVAALAVVASLALLAIAPGTVSAHNTLISSDPADGAQLSASPERISFVFDLAVPLETAGVQVIDATGVRTDVTGLAHGPTGETEVIAPLPPGLTGSVTVRWRLVSADGHAITGRVSLTIAAPGTTAAGSTEASTATAPITTPTTTAPAATPGSGDGDGAADAAAGAPAAVRWMLRFGSYLAIGVLVGVVLTDRLVWPGSIARPSFRRLASWALALVAALAVLQLLVVAGDIAGRSALAAAGSLDDATLTDVGLALALRVLLAAVAWLLVFRMDVADATTRWTGCAIVGVALMGTWAWAGHAKSQRWPWVGVPVDVVHHTAAALWIGALTIVGGVALTSLSAVDLAPVLRRMSSVAAVSVGLIVTTGIVQSVRLVGGPAALLDGAHGRAVVAKLVLVGAMLVLANRNRVRIAGIAADARDADARGVDAGMVASLRSSIVAEFVIGVVVVGVTAAMVVATPAVAG